MRRAVWLPLLLVAHAALAAPAPAPFLWEVHTGQSRHYLMGSVHLLPASAHPLPDALDAAYNAAQVLVFESDLEALSGPAAQRQMLAQAQAPGGLAQQIGSALYRRVQDFATRKQLPPAVCDRFKAWFCALTLELLTFEKSGYRAQLGIDQHFHTRARAANKTILWLEQPDAHLALFFDMNSALAAQMLRATLEQDSSSGASPEALLQAWRGNDAAALAALAAEFKRRHPPLYERLLAARNRAWMPQLTALLKEPAPHLVIVGAAHLVGPDGLVALLQSQGYQVRPAAKP